MNELPGGRTDFTAWLRKKMKKIVVIKTGSTFAGIKERLGDFEDWIIKGLRVDTDDIMVIDAPFCENLPDRNKCRAVVIAGSHDMVTDNPDWSVRIEKWVLQIMEKQIPVLGICYGHQLLAQALGGTVDFHEKGLEIGTADIELTAAAGDDLLFAGLPEIFKGHVFHSQTVVRLPEQALLLAKNDFEPHHAFRMGNLVWGVQFHPEYDEKIMRAYAEKMRSAVEESGFNPKDILKNIRKTPDASALLNRFGKLAMN